MPVNKPRQDHADMLPKWSRLRDCFGGRDAVLKAGVKYVPLLPGADGPQNEAYRARGNFYNAVGRTVGGMNGAVFQKPPEVALPERGASLLADITLTNVTFESFSTEIGKETLLLGRHGVLIDMPIQPGPGEAGPQRAEVDMRPFCVNYKAEDIINWKTERRGGDNILTMLVLQEDEELSEPNDPFSSKRECQYRVLRLVGGGCISEIWKQKTDHKDEYEVAKSVVLMRRGEPLDFIPFIFFGALRPNPDIEQPPLIDLADVNLGHWRNSVDHEYGLHLVALPTPWMSGAKGNNTGPLKMGPSVVWELEVQGAAGMLEFTGEGLKAIVAAMDEKKKQMASLGARLLEDAAVTQETLGAVKLRHGGETASLRTVAQSLEQGLKQVLQICMWWDGTDADYVDVPAEVELNKEYLNVRATSQEIQVGLTALQAGEISFETWYNMLVTGGWAREGIDSEQEQKDIAKRKIDVTEPPPIDG